MADPPWKTEWLSKDLQTNKSVEIFRELHIVQEHPRMLILVTHGFLEMMVEALIKHHLKNSKKIIKDGRGYPFSTRLLILNEVGVIHDQWYKFLDWFRKLRNRAAHDAIFEVTPKDLAHLHSSVQSPSNFYPLCLMLVRQFWDEFEDVLAPYLAPDKKTGGDEHQEQSGSEQDDAGKPDPAAS
ncbi:MAG: hypothetical protein AB7I98_04510 [Verrucomicrobiales bacterium]|nr:hypothetical protein [Verrucomicrobiae bacterium]